MPGSKISAPITGPRLTLLIDGKCPLCSREASWLARRDKKGRLGFIDIASEGFDPARYGKAQDEVMGAIHAVTSEGEVLTGVEVFRRAYGEIGLGWLLAPTRLPILRQIADVLYMLFARIRPRLRGAKGECEGGSCKIG